MFFFYVFYVQQKTEQPFDLSTQTRILNMEISKKTQYKPGFARKAVGVHLRKEVIHMPLTVTFHIGKLTITITVKLKSNNRHSAK